MNNKTADYTLLLTLLFIGSTIAAETNTNIQTFETRKAKDAVQEYSQEGKNMKSPKVERALQDLKSEINELKVYVDEHQGEDRKEAQQKLDALQSRYNDLEKDYTLAKFKALGRDVKDSWNKMTDSFLAKGENDKALERLDSRMKRLKEEIGYTSGNEKDEAKKRYDDLDTRRDNLKKNFNKQEYHKLTSDVNREIEKLQ